VNVVTQRIILKGVVASGVGGAKNFLDLPGVKQQIEEKLGLKPYSGTLNIWLNKESAKRLLELQNDKEENIHPQVGTFPGVLIKASIESVECAIVHPQDPNYSSDILEVIAPINLREELKLLDGSKVTIMVKIMG
jgi:riboflavin kinase, archaea type